MPRTDFQSSDVAAAMAKQLSEHSRYANLLSGINTDRIVFLHAIGKKKPERSLNAAIIKAVNDWQRAINDDFVFVIFLFEEWFEWSEAKQFASLLEALLLIKNDGRVTFEDGKLNKYDVHGLNFMVANFGLNWTHDDNVKHPIEDDFAQPGQTTFRGSSGTAQGSESNAVNAVVDPEDLDDLDQALDQIPDEIEN